MTVAEMLQVEPLEIRSHSDNTLNQAASKPQPYQAQHPHSQHHRRLRAAPKQPEPEIEIVEDACTSPDTSDGNPNDPFEKHFLAAALASPPAPHFSDPKVRSASFRNDKPKPNVKVRDPDLNTTGNYSSSPNLLFPKDDLHFDSRSHDGRDAPLRRVRSFKTSNKGGVINRGDSFRKRHSSRNVATGSMNGRDSPRLAISASQPIEFECTPKTEVQQNNYFKVQVIGAPGCGKTSITNQFMSSDYANAFDSMNVDEVERTVTIQLDGEETTMEFIDALPWDGKEPIGDNGFYDSFQDTVEHDIDITADAYVVVYSVIDRGTYDAAVAHLYKLRHGLGTDRPIVIVGNKIDLVRKRKVKKDEVASICRTYDCLHFETSAALNHHVDELLISLLKQIRHKLNPDLYPSPVPAEPDPKSQNKGGFFTRLYRRLSRKGRPKSKK